jgi:hypothetical protein
LIHIVGYDQIPAEKGTDIKMLAQKNLQASLYKLSPSHPRGGPVYGNTKSIQLITERDNIRSKLNEIEGVGKRLSQGSQEHLSIRHRFLDVFQREALGEPAAKKAETIKIGNLVAHCGDAIMDASLFKNGTWIDKELIVKEYGLTFEDVLFLGKMLCPSTDVYWLILYIGRNGDRKCIKALNARATLKADKYNPIPQDIELKWEKFVNELNKYWKEIPVDDPTTSLGEAYFRFWVAHYVHEKQKEQGEH